MATNPKPERRKEKLWLKQYRHQGKYHDVKLHMKLKDTGHRAKRKIQNESKKELVNIMSLFGVHIEFK